MGYNKIVNKVKNTIFKYNLISKNDIVLIGVSGGPDSVAMLYILNALSKALGFSLQVAHLDHKLRKNSFKDSEFVQSLADKLNLPLCQSRIDVKALSEKGSVEEAARNARLEFFVHCAKRIRAKKIALGHTVDDQAETVLMRLIRGAGLSGLCGILPKRKILGFEVIRPLIEVKRKEIELFLEKRKIKYRVDETNSQEIYLRNKIRLQLLPLLEKCYNRNIKEVLAKTAEIVGSDYDYLSQETACFAKVLSKRIDLFKFRKLHIAMQRMLIRYNISLLVGDTRRVTFKHLEEIADLVDHRPLNSIVDLPKGVSVIKKRKALLFFKRKQIPAKFIR